MKMRSIISELATMTLCSVTVVVCIAKYTVLPFLTCKMENFQRCGGELLPPLVAIHTG